MSTFDLNQDSKPSLKNAPSNKAVIGRYILPTNIFKKFTKYNSRKKENSKNESSKNRFISKN